MRGRIFSALTCADVNLHPEQWRRAPPQERRAAAPSRLPIRAAFPVLGPGRHPRLHSRDAQASIMLRPVRLLDRLRGLCHKALA
jgi:hypothetical protein